MKLSGDMAEFWTRVHQRWDAGVEAIHGDQPLNVVVRKPSIPFIRPVQMPIVVTGERGTGKTALYSSLIGKTVSRERRSESEEAIRVAVRATGPKEKVRSSLVVVPGQSSRPADEVLKRIFGGNAAPRGVIHVVSAGYDWVWDESARSIVDDSLVKDKEDRQSERARLSGRNDAESITRLSQLDDLDGRPPIWHLRRKFEEQEAARFRALCQNYIRPAWASARKTQSIWLIIAVSKCDLWFREIESVRSRYLPGLGAPESPFASELRELVADVGATRLSKLAVVPFASFPSVYRFSKMVGEQLPTLEKGETNRLVDHFRNLVGEFCGSR